MAKKVYSDAGHGGKDPGAVDGRSGDDTLYTEEAAINLDCALKYGEAMLRCGAEVKQSRRIDSYPTLEARATAANEWPATVFVSWHSNKFGTETVRGIEVLHYPDSEEGIALATKVFGRLDDVSPWADRDLRPRDNLYLLSHTRMPAIIIECGFISNTNEERMLRTPEYRTLLAEAAAHGTCEYLGLTYKPKPVEMVTPPAPVVEPPAPEPTWSVSAQAADSITLTRR